MKIFNKVGVKLEGKKTKYEGVLLQDTGAKYPTTYLRILDVAELLNRVLKNFGIEIEITGHGTYVNIAVKHNKNVNKGLTDEEIAKLLIEIESTILDTLKKKDDVEEEKPTAEDILGIELPPFERNLLTNTTEFSNRKNPKNDRIVVHYTANFNKGANEDTHRSYFNRAKYNINGNRIYANYNFIIGNRKILQLLEDGAEGWHAGNRAMNQRSIGISMCVNSDYDFEITEKATAYWVAVQMKKWNIPIQHVIRHYDVTVKNCPAMYVGSSNEKAWQNFKDLVVKILEVL